MRKKWGTKNMKKVNQNDAKKWKEFIDTMNDGDAKKVTNSSIFDEVFENSEIKALFELAKLILLLVSFTVGLVLLINYLS